VDRIQQEAQSFGQLNLASWTLAPFRTQIRNKDNRFTIDDRGKFLYVNLPLRLLTSRVAVNDRLSNSGNNE
jgi:hypothetical protein